MTLIALFLLSFLSLLSSAPVGKIVPLQRHLSQQHAQFLLLRQNALQQQQQHQVGGGATSLTTTAPGGGIPRLQTPPQSVMGTQKVALPAGIEQLRPSIPSLPLQQRFTAAVTSAANAMRNITSRSLQTEEVLALLKQQSLRMAASQTYRTAHPTTQHQREGVVSTQHQREGVVSTQLQAQLTRPAELTKSAIVLTSEAPSSFSLSVTEQGKKPLTQSAARVVHVPITTAVSIPPSSQQQSSVATPTSSSTPQAPPTSTTVQQPTRPTDT